jgi:hypothetical protein
LTTTARDDNFAAEDSALQQRGVLVIRPNDDGKMITLGEKRTRAEGQISRRSLLRGGLALGAVTAGLTAASAFSAESAFAASQSDWLWCSNCAILFFGGHGDVNDPCPGNISDGTMGGHIPGSQGYVLNYNTSLTGYQPNWCFCSACQALFYLPDIETSACPGTLGFAGLVYAPHTQGSSSNYLVSLANQAGTFQPGWDYCTNCRTLFHGSGKATGHCAGNYVFNAEPTFSTGDFKPHAPNSTPYFVQEG